MTTPPLDLPALRDIANAATQDFWWHDLVGVPGQRPEDKEWVVDSNPTFICSTQVGTKRGESDASHIAAFDPPTVLALLDRAEAAEAKVAAVRARHRPVSVMEAWGTHGRDLDGAMACAVCTSPDDAGVTLHPCPELIALDGTP